MNSFEPDHFVIAPHLTRVVFGAGSVSQIPEELARAGWTRVLLISTPRRSDAVESVRRRLGSRCVAHFDRAEMHVPAATAAAAVAAARAVGADAVVAVGGGSPIGVAKIIARDLALPVIAVPTTYSGSEMTAIWGVTTDGVKTTGRDPRVLPALAIYDPELLLSLSAAITGPSGLNAIAHAVEGLYAPDANPITSLMAEEAIRAMASGLPAAVARPDDIDARAQTLYAAWLAGSVLGSVGMGLHHKLCHTLGGSFGLPHAEVHAIVLPHVVAYNSVAAAVPMARVARALGGRVATEAAGLLFDLLLETRVETALASIGLAEVDIDRAARLAMMVSYPNPRTPTYPAIRKILGGAFHGERPET